MLIRRATMPARNAAGRLRMACVLALAPAVLSVAACGSSSPDDGRTAGLRPMSWGAVEMTGPREMKIGGEADYCWGDPKKPKVERARTRYRGEAAYITAEATPPSEESVDGDKCSYVGLPVFKVVTLRRNLRGIVLYDASTTPPEVRWPEQAVKAAGG